jgi:hypothetical protein
MGSANTAASFTHSFRQAMLISAALAAGGGVIAWATIRRTQPVQPTVTANVLQPCHDACRAGEVAA